MNTRKFLLASLFITGLLFAEKSYSQVYVNAHIGFGIPGPRVYYAPAPAPVVYEESYPSPPPAPCYNDGYQPAPVVVVNHGYGYYHNRYDYARGYERPYIARDYNRNRYDQRGYDRGRYDHRGYDHGRDHGRNW